MERQGIGGAHGGSTWGEPRRPAGKGPARAGSWGGWGRSVFMVREDRAQGLLSRVVSLWPDGPLSAGYALVRGAQAPWG